MPDDPPFTGKTYRCTHRVDSPGLPSTFCLREADALEAAAERGSAHIYIHGRNARTGAETWDFWRSYP